ncbi:MAG: transporter permease [Bacteroidetes bacterium]|nr:transporter permease [Bacteroidota bacterium]
MEYEIKPRNKFSLGLKELWQYRELFYTFTWRDVKIKYKQTYLGMAWALFQPIVMTILFTLSFGKIISSNTALSLPYPVFALSGFILWNIFSSGLSNAGNSMIANSNMIKKIYFPRLIIPISSILVSLIDFVISFLVFIPVLYYYGCGFHLRSLVLIPLSLLLTCFCTFGLGTFLAALNVKYRDFRYILPFFIQALLFATPVIYPVKISDNSLFGFIMQFNPMSAPIELFRNSFSNYNLNIQDIIISVVVSLFLFIGGIYYFRRTEAYFADLA